MTQYSLLIKQWLREKPSPLPEQFAMQAASAAWLERRFHQLSNTRK